MRDCEQILFNACEEVGVTLTSEMLEQFKKYFNILVEWNEKINLTAITEESDVYFKHFADCVFLAKFLKQGAKVCDIGTGAGFPGVVLKIVRPDIKLVLVDSLNKRINFLNLVKTELGLQNVECLHFRAEDKAFKSQCLNSFDYVVARAVARLNTLTEYCLPYVKVGGKFISMKSIKAEEELIEAENAIKVLGGKFNFIESYEVCADENIFKNILRYNKITNIVNNKEDLDNSEKLNRVVIAIDKKSLTNNKYPRDLNKPRIKPL